MLGEQEHSRTHLSRLLDAALDGAVDVSHSGRADPVASSPVEDAVSVLVCLGGADPLEGGVRLAQEVAAEFDRAAPPPRPPGQ